MKPPSEFSGLVPRLLLFGAMLVLIVYMLHFLLPAPIQAEPADIALNPLLQIGLFMSLGLLGALIGFWITFGDLVNRGEK
jgi:hypothetical protein